MKDLPHIKGDSKAVEFMAERHEWTDLSYIPPNPNLMLSQEESGRLFDSLKLGEQYPNTINSDAFHTIIQRPARLANWYFIPDEKKPIQQAQTVSVTPPIALNLPTSTQKLTTTPATGPQIIVLFSLISMGILGLILRKYSYNK